MIRNLIRDRSGSSAAEFAMVLPLLLLFMFGIIDAGRWLWTYNKAEKATMMGTRMAAVTDFVSSSIGNSYLGSCSPALTQGDQIPANCFSTITCTSSGCDTGTKNDAAFTAIVDQMKLFLPDIDPSNVTIRYSPSGLGYAGNPSGADLSPLVTVELHGVQFRPITAFLIASMTMPTTTTTLTGEDLRGAQSN